MNNMLAKLPFRACDSHRRRTAPRPRLGRAERQEMAAALRPGCGGGLIGGIIGDRFLYVPYLAAGEPARGAQPDPAPESLGEDVTDLYFTKMGAMVRGTVRASSSLRWSRGVLGAASIYIGGFHSGFFLICIFLTARYP